MEINLISDEDCSSERGEISEETQPSEHDDFHTLALEAENELVQPLVQMLILL